MVCSREEEGGGRVGQLSAAPSRRWARLIARTCEDGHRAVCGGGLVGGLLDVLDLEAVVEGGGGGFGQLGGALSGRT